MKEIQQIIQIYEFNHSLALSSDDKKNFIYLKIENFSHCTHIWLNEWMKGLKVMMEMYEFSSKNVRVCVCDERVRWVHRRDDKGIIKCEFDFSLLRFSFLIHSMKLHSFESFQLSFSL